MQNETTEEPDSKEPPTIEELRELGVWRKELLVKVKLVADRRDEMIIELARAGTHTQAEIATAAGYTLPAGLNRVRELARQAGVPRRTGGGPRPTTKGEQ
jgi:hypothetical protein